MASEKPLLRDPDIEPNDDLLKAALGDKVFAVYSELIQTVVSDFDMQPLWRHYKDGGAWLCKVVYKKKTIFWLSVWEHYFKAVFYFTEKTTPGITELHISDDLKQSMYTSESFGKFIPMIFTLTKLNQLKDLLMVVAYKKGLK